MIYVLYIDVPGLQLTNSSPANYTVTYQLIYLPFVTK
jgi:hypothetical protein